MLSEQSMSAICTVQGGETLYEAVKQGQGITYSEDLEQLVDHIFIQLPTRSSTAPKVSATQPRNN